MAGGVRALARAAVTVAVDTADAADVDRLFDTAAAHLGPVTGLVNNPGVSGPVGPLADTDPDGMRQALEVNVLGYLLCARRAIGDMTAGGAIVNISSAAAPLGSPGTYVHYAAAKAAVDAMTVGLSKVAAVTPMGRAGRPEEIAGAVAWLLSDDASYATGTVMRIAGGM